MKEFQFTLLAFIAAVMTSFAQDTLQSTHKLTLSGYADTYFAAYNTRLSPQEFQDFIAVGPRDNSFGVNMAQIGLSYEHAKVRSNLIIHTGDIALATWSDDFPHLQQANVGIRLAEKLWLDAGFFSTHLGAESFLPKNNMLSSIAVLTYNEPFFQSGAKLSWDASDKLYTELWVLNGYHSLVDNNEAKSIGVLLSYSFSENTSLTYTNLYGRESEEEAADDQNRFYQNIYLNHEDGNLSFTAAFDLGIQSHSNPSKPNGIAVIYGGLITARYQFNPEWSVTGRGELFNDENGFISGVMPDTNGNLAGLEMTAFTLGAEYRPLEKSYFRVEARHVSAADDLKIFPKDTPDNQRLEFLVTLGIEIDKVFRF